MFIYGKQLSSQETPYQATEWIPLVSKELKQKQLKRDYSYSIGKVTLSPGWSYPSKNPIPLARLLLLVQRHILDLFFVETKHFSNSKTTPWFFFIMPFLNLINYRHRKYSKIKESHNVLKHREVEFCNVKQVLIQTYWINVLDKTKKKYTYITIS